MLFFRPKIEMPIAQISNDTLVGLKSGTCLLANFQIRVRGEQ